MALCPKCGAGLPQGAQFCANCGTSFTQTASPQNISPSLSKQRWTGAQKAGWFFVGLLGNLVGVLIASLTNVGHPDRSTATKMAIFGLITPLVIFVLLFLLAYCAGVALISSGYTPY